MAKSKKKLAEKIYIPKNLRFLLIGGGDEFRCFLRHFRSTFGDHADALVITDPRLEAAGGEFEDRTAQEICSSTTYSYLATADLNGDQAREKISDIDPNLALVFGWGKIFKDEFLSRFHGRILNMHTAPLPRYRGAGGFSWQVMHNERNVTVTIHQMVREIDAGSILFQETAALDEEKIYPETVKNMRYELMNERVIPRLLSLLKEEKELVLFPQNQDEAEYFPRLFTPENGFIDFSWDVESVESFIRAFSYPYPGSTVRYGSDKYRITEAGIRSRNRPYHPFCYGLITNITGSGIDVIVNSGIIRFEKIVDIEGNETSFDQFRIGNRFYNAPEDLLNARLFRPANA